MWRSPWRNRTSMGRALFCCSACTCKISRGFAKAPRLTRKSTKGKKEKAYYRVVVIERTRPHNGRVRELVGTYDPLKKPAEVKLDAERIKYWLGVGAQPSDTVRSFLRAQKIS